MEAALADLKQRLAEIADLEAAKDILDWDLAVWMPPRGETARASQLATLETVIHTRRTDERIGELLDALEPKAASLDPASDDACLLRVARRNWERARRVPTSLAAELAGAEADAYATWVRAREASDYAMFKPELSRMLELKLRWVECFAPYDDPYDVFLDEYDEGLRASDVEAVFDVLRPALTELVDAHAAGPDDTDDAFLRVPYPASTQEALGRELCERFGATWDAFRLDPTVHPFAVRFGQNDIRLTTAYEERGLSSLFSAMHECGHGLYEWGSAVSLDRTPLTGGGSSSLHESQSRLWENLVGRSRPFWSWFYPRLQEEFPDQLGTVELDRFYRAINRVERSFIRIDADETSYGLHIVLRFQLERQLVTGRLSVDDLPDAWNAGFRDLMGVAVPDDRHGVLQDVHWSVGLLGYFPTYLLGSVLAVQIWERLHEDVPDVDAQIARGDFSAIHAWLQDHLYALGRKLRPRETIARAAGGPIDPQPYLAYLPAKLA